MKLKNQLKKINSVRIAHIIRKYNSPADYIASEALRLRKGRIVTDDDTINNLQQQNTLPELLYQEADQNKITVLHDSIPSICSLWSSENTCTKVDIFNLQKTTSKVLRSGRVISDANIIDTKMSGSNIPREINDNGLNEFSKISIQNERFDRIAKLQDT